MSGVISFDDLREACRAGGPEGWLRFAELYAPVVRHLLEHHFSGEGGAALLPKVFEAARAEPGELLGEAGGNEKEFLLRLRDLVFRIGREARGPGPTPPQPSPGVGPAEPEKVAAALESFPVLQQQLLALALRGYSPETLKVMLRFEPETTRGALEQFTGKLGAASSGALAAGAGKALVAAASAAPRGEQCVAESAFARWADGQMTWRERETTDRHMAECIHCLNRSAEYLEVFHFFRMLPPASANDVEEIAAALGLPAAAAATKKKTPWWLRLLGG